MRFELSSSSWGPEEVQAAKRILDGGRYTMGENVRAFEQGFARKFGIKHGVMVNSGSSANLVAVASLFYKKDRPLKPGDEVLVPSISWATTYYPLMQYGLKLRFLDVDLQTLNMDTSKLEAALTPRTRMVVAVSILGNPAALDVIRSFCDKHGLYMFEDNCESMGAELGGKPCGTFGDINTFSLFFSHHISTMEGGVILTNDEELHHLARSIRAHGWTRDLPPDTKLYQKNDDDFFEAYRFILPGYNVRPLEISAAIGLEQLKKLDDMNEIRRRNAKLFVELFAGDPRFIIQKENGRSSWFSFTVILNPQKGINRRKVMTALRDAGIQFRIITGGCFLRHDVIRYCQHDTVGEVVNANIAHDWGFFVGNHPRDLAKELRYFREVIDRAAR
ncbi:MAG: DegT/DnrJ/EryC1/StrS family aminotransferase [Elusimicrobia bacterium]|nr:DegT/DnrJ/EryC1/StrS family aminotransferase [Elusimicrobiota bacterium]